MSVDAELTTADGYAERATAIELLARLPGRRRRTVAADKGYDTKAFVAECRDLVNELLNTPSTPEGEAKSAAVKPLERPK